MEAQAGVRRAGRGTASTMLVAALVVTDLAYAFQQSAIIPAIPTVQEALGTSEAWSAWLLSGYLMLATVATPALGRYADLHGRKRVLLTSLAVFLAGSVGAAAAPDIATLIVFRAVQGLGGVVFPLSFAVVHDELPRRRVALVIGGLTGAFGVGTALGFGLGGMFAEVVSWRLIFLVGAALIAGGLVLVAAFVPRSRATARGTFDRPGLLWLGAATVALLLALTLGAQIGWLRATPIALLVVSVAAAVGWVRVELRAPTPLVDLRVFGARPVLFTNIATVGLGWALFGSYFLLPQFVETPPSRTGYGLGADATLTGLYLLPAAVGQLLAGPLAGPLQRRFGAARVFAAGLALAAVALAVFATNGQSAAQVLVGAFLLGAGVGLGIQTSGAVATQAVSDEQTATSTALNSTVRRFAGGVGGQISAILLATLVVAGAGEPSRLAFLVAFVVAAGLALLGSAVAACIPARGA